MFVKDFDKGFGHHLKYCGVENACNCNICFIVPLALPRFLKAHLLLGRTSTRSYIGFFYRGGFFYDQHFSGEMRKIFFKKITCAAQRNHRFSFIGDKICTPINVYFAAGIFPMRVQVYTYID